MRESSVPPPLRERLRAALREAQRHRDAAAVAALRVALGAIDNGEAVPLPPPPLPHELPAVGPSRDVPRRPLSEAEMRAIVQREADDFQQAAAHHAALHRPAEATELAARHAVLAALLAPPVSRS